MPLQKQNFLSVSYNLKKGLVLKWNFTDLHHDRNYFHHLFIIYNTNKSLTESLLQIYYKKMKFGDLLSIVYCDQHLQAKQMNWIEKSQIQIFNVSRLVKRFCNENLSREQEEDLTDKAREISHNSTENMVVNFLLSDHHHQQKDHDFIRIIQQARRQGSFNYICTLFGSFKRNDITFNGGINTINTQNRQPSQAEHHHTLSKTINFYHMMINSAALKRADVTIQCTKGQMITHNPKIWKNPGFNRIERTFYGPSVSYEQDQIYFLLMDNFQNCEFEMLINLELYQFSNQKYTASKKIKLSFPDGIQYGKSLNFSSMHTAVHLYGVEMESYPFSTNSFVRLFSQSE